MLEWLKRAIYVTEDKFGLADYRKPIPRFDKLLVAGGILAGILGRLGALACVVAYYTQNASGDVWRLLIASILVWWCGDYFCRTGHRGLIYAHMDLLADWIEARPEGK